MPHWIIGVFY